MLIRWSRPHPDAGTLTGGQLPSLPRHILNPRYEAGNPEAFLASPFWTREYVGLGPFRVTQWEPASFYEATAFDKYVFGRPLIERIKILIMPDSNTVLASMLAGEVHFAADQGLRAAQIPTFLEQRGERAGAIQQADQWRAVVFQLRSEYAAPGGLLDPRVRKALAHVIDKVAVNEAAYTGQNVPSDIMVPPEGQAGRAIDAAIAKYPLDLRKSEELMASAGFVRGADGTFVNATGRFASEVKTNAAPDSEAEVSILASTWRQAGFDVRQAVLPTALGQDGEARATFSGMFSYSSSLGEGATATYTSGRIPTQENRWQGGNRGAWSDPDYDRLADTFSTTLDGSERTRLLVEMARIFADRLPAIPLFFRAHPYVFVSELKGPRPLPADSNIAWDIQRWEFR